jgi:hypothetical protein
VEPGAQRDEGQNERSSSMTTHILSRWRAAMTTRLMNDAERATTLTGIQKAAPQGTLIQIPGIAASVAALGTKGTAFATDVAAAASNEVLFRASVTARDLARFALDLELDTYRTLVENNATNAGDVTSMGLTLLTLAATSRTPPDPPAALLVRPGTARGKARVTVAGNGYLGTFAAEVSTDPVGAATWSSLPGTGKQRKLAGYASGTKLWVHFATIRFGMQCAWSVPVLVTIP